MTGTNQPTLFGFFLRQSKCSDEDVGLNRPTTPENNSFPNRMSAEDESTPDRESDIMIIEDKQTSNAAEENIQLTTNT